MQCTNSHTNWYVSQEMGRNDLHCLKPLSCNTVQRKPLCSVQKAFLYIVWDWMTNLRNWSWKRSRCPCKVSAGRPERHKAASNDLRKIKLVLLFSGFYKSKSNSKSHRRAAWRGAWQWSGRDDCCPEWPGWVAQADTGLMSERWWRWSCWAGESLGQIKEGTSCVRHLCCRKSDSNKITSLVMANICCTFVHSGNGGRFFDPANMLVN